MDTFEVVYKHDGRYHYRTYYGTVGEVYEYTKRLEQKGYTEVVFLWVEDDLFD